MTEHPDDHGPTPSDPLVQRFDPPVLVLARQLEAGRVDLDRGGRVYVWEGKDRGWIHFDTIGEEPHGFVRLARFQMVAWGSHDHAERMIRGLRLCEIIDLHGAPLRILSFAKSRLVQQ